MLPDLKAILRVSGCRHTSMFLAGAIFTFMTGHLFSRDKSVNQSRAFPVSAIILGASRIPRIMHLL